MFSLHCFEVDMLKLPKNRSQSYLGRLSAVASKYPFIKHSKAKRSKARPPQSRRKGITDTQEICLGTASQT